MFAEGSEVEARRRMRRGLLGRYVRLQRDLVSTDPASAAYHSTVHAFRQMGYTLISSGFEEDLDRLLRLRLVDGGRSFPTPAEERERPADLHLVVQNSGT